MSFSGFGSLYEKSDDAQRRSLIGLHKIIDELEAGQFRQTHADDLVLQRKIGEMIMVYHKIDLEVTDALVNARKKIDELRSQLLCTQAENRRLEILVAQS